jgi:hypothetical protein
MVVGATVRWYVLVLLGSVAVLATTGAIVGALTGRGTWHTASWAFIIGGAAFIICFAAGGAPSPRADPRIGMGFPTASVSASTPAGLILVGLVLVGLGVAGLLA